MTLTGSHPSLLLSVSDDRTLRLWDCQSSTADVRESPPLSTAYEHGGRAFCVAYSTESGLVASGAGDGSLCLWRIGEEGMALELAYKTELRGCGAIRNVEFAGRDLVRPFTTYEAKFEVRRFSSSALTPVLSTHFASSLPNCPVIRPHYLTQSMAGGSASSNIPPQTHATS